MSPSIVARRSIDQLTRHVRLLGKFFRRLQQLNAARFVTLPMSSDIILYYWSMIVQATNSDTNSITGEKLGMIAGVSHPLLKFHSFSESGIHK